MLIGEEPSIEGELEGNKYQIAVYDRTNGLEDADRLPPKSNIPRA